MEETIYMREIKNLQESKGKRCTEYRIVVIVRDVRA